MSENIPTPTAAELAILQLLWQKSPLSVREIHDQLESDRPTVYTTTLKTMQVMMERGLLTRTGAGRKHVYSPAVAQEATQDTLLDRFLDRAFAGSASELALRALGKRTPSATEIETLREFLDSISPSENPGS